MPLSGKAFLGLCRIDNKKKTSGKFFKEEQTIDFKEARICFS